MIASHVVDVDEPMNRDEAAALCRFINAELVGVPFSRLLDSLERRLLSEQDAFYHLVKRSLQILTHALSTEPEERLFLEGTSFLMSQPEFSRHPHKAHELLRQLEAHQELLQWLHQQPGVRGVSVWIGHEVALRSLRECSVISAPFFLGGSVAGCVGALGPKRMDYPHISVLVDGMAQCMTEILEQWTSA